METIPILLPYGYYVNEADVQTAKNYVLRRESAAHGLASLVDALIKDAATRITEICYRYDVDPQRFTLSSDYDKEMFEEVAQVLDQLEDEIMDLLLDYATRCTKSEERKKSLLPWILLLGRGNRNLQQTLEGRMRMFMKDIEAMIASMSLAKYDLQKAITRIKTGLHAVYVMPEVKAAFAHSAMMQATYIRSKGVKYGNVGNSNSEANNILRFGETTVQMAWMRNQLMNFKENGAAGYYQLRGSTYPCTICDEQVGLHLGDFLNDSYPHAHCMCFRIPVYINNK